jgi:iron(III) transport system substrate-binding protein
MTIRTRRLPLLAFVLAAGVLLAACGSSPTTSGGGRDLQSSDVARKAQQVYDKMNALRGQERTSQLVAAAAAEGSLAIYTSNTDIDKVVDGFKEKYPKIKVNVYRANSETVLQRVLQEQKAGFYGNDILETNAGELDITARDGYLADYRSEYRDKVRKDGQRKDWTASRFNVFVIGWNTKLVKPGEEPRSLDELADPKWKGRISMELSDVVGVPIDPPSRAPLD